MIHPNSRTAYEEKVKPTLSAREKEVYRILLLHGELTTWEVALKMGKTPNQISGRFKPMEVKGLIKWVGKRSINGTQHSIWKVVTPEPKSEPGLQGRMNF
jgi:predicted transcriptional regulator